MGSQSFVLLDRRGRYPGISDAESRRKGDAWIPKSKVRGELPWIGSDSLFASREFEE
jgi:hypothetical protein